jgi:hypothetical protein
VDLASRLSFFLWGTPPDQELLDLAAQRQAVRPKVLERRPERMLADPRAEALGTRFAAQWLRLQDLDKVHPDPNFYPTSTSTSPTAMRRETELFFNTWCARTAALLDLYTADYTFVNERLAQHYGIPGVSGDEFRKVSYPDDDPPRAAGQGSVLVQTSHGQPHLAGAARQVGDGGAAGHAAAAAAAERADLEETADARTARC